jgi:hypothetical protein
MTLELDSQVFDSFVPVYDVVPEKWEDARAFLIEHLKKISTAVNTREISFMLDEQLISGKQFIPNPDVVDANSGTSEQFRTVFRKVVNTGPLIGGANPPVPHGIVFNSNFTLVDMWISATNSTSFNAVTMSDPQNLTMDVTNINITSPGVFDRSYWVCEYLLEM